MSGPAPNVPSPGLTGLGKGRFVRSRRGAVLERLEGSEWRPMARYGSTQAASAALDDAVAAGAEPSTMRVVEASASTAARVLYAIGAVVLLAFFAFAMYALLR
jgi:hypothetical protein